MITTPSLNFNFDGAGEVPPTEKLSLFPTRVQGNSPEHQVDLADKYNIALGVDSPGSDAMLTAIRSNDTGRYADLLATQEALQLEQAKNDLVVQIASSGIDTPFDREIVQGLSAEQMASPRRNTILEEAYAKKLTNLQTSMLEEENSSFTQAVNEDVDKAYEDLDITEKQSTQNLIAHNLLNELKTEFDASGILSQGLAWAQQIVPFRNDLSIANSPITDSQKSFFTGDTKVAMYAYLRQQWPDETDRQLRAYVAREKETGNYLGAMEFVEGFLSYSTLDQVGENAQQAFDIATSLPVGLFAKSLRGVARAVVVPVKETERMASVAGMPAEAARVAMSKSLDTGILPSRDIKSIADIERIFPSIGRPQEMFNAGVPLRAPAAALVKLEQAAIARGGRAAEILNGLSQVAIDTPRSVETAVAEARQFVADHFVHANHMITDVVRNEAEKNMNIDSIDVRIGKADGSYYTSEIAAYKAAKMIFRKTNDAKVVELPTGGWAIEVRRNLDMTTDGVRKVAIDTGNKLPDNITTHFFGKAVGADMLMSEEQRVARGAAVMSTEHMGALLRENAKPIFSLSKNEKKEFEQFIIADRSYVHPKWGRNAPRDTVHDFEEAFYTQFGKAPSLGQIDSYLAHKNIIETQHAINAMSVFKQEARLGIEKFSMSIKGADDVTSTLEFKGKAVEDFPRGGLENYSIAILNDDGTLIEGRNLTSRSMGAKDWERLDALKAKGYTIVQAYKRSQKVGEKYFNFIMVKNFKRDPVDMEIKHVQGSHVISRQPWYIKQPVLSAKDGRVYYRRDAGIMSFRSYDEAKEAEPLLNKLRKMIKNKDPEAERFFNDNFPFWNYKEFMVKVEKKEFDVNSPVVITKAGSRTFENKNFLETLQKEGIDVNHFQSDSDLDLSKNVVKRFAGETSEANAEVFGVENNVLLKLDVDPYVSPLEAVRYSMSDMVDTHVIHDYRVKSVRDWTLNYQDILKADKGTIDTEAMSMLYAPEYLPNAPANRVASAETQRKAIVSLFDNKTFVEKQIDLYKEKVVRSVRGLAGAKAADFTDGMLHKAQNADQLMRSFAAHSKLGFFNLRQLFLQSLSGVNIVGIAGAKHGGRGAMAAWPLILAMNTKHAFVKGIGTKLQGITTFSADEFEELSAMYRKSGFYHVGGDVAYLDNAKPADVVKGKIGWVLDKGMVPFKTGESIARSMAFAAAYSERKAILGAKGFKRVDEQWVLDRAKTLTGNMTRDSNAAYQRGYGAIATQFFGYQMRLMEQMMSGGLFGNGKLTRMEKARLFTTMGLMYGVPVATGMTFGVVPIREMIKDWLAKEGVEYDDTLAEPFMDGFASSFLEMATGMDLNVSERMGPGGLTTFYDMLKGDAELNDILLGASGGIIGDTIKNSGGIIKFIWNAIDFNDKTDFPLSAADVLAPFRTISTVNNSVKLFQAVNLGKWISKNETILTDVNAMEGFTSALLGLDPERVSDAFNKIEAVSSEAEMQKEVMKTMVVDYKRAFRLLKDGFPAEASQLIIRTKAQGVLGGLDWKQMNTVMDRARNEEPLDQAMEDTYNKYTEKKAK